MGKITVPALRTVLVVVLAGSLFVQTVMVALPADDMEDGVLADGRLPLLLIVVLGIGAAQAVLVCAWRLVAALCEVLDCRPGDLLRWEAESLPGEATAAGRHR
ncbi:helix-turn-helix domain-containing protein [Streptomyces rochei]|uniref:helix-turn-helix domain-containing protein n=1 Tax=Streptomyces rochei TaxID=1928 RepID=UPI0033D726A8